MHGSLLVWYECCRPSLAPGLSLSKGRGREPIAAVARMFLGPFMAGPGSTQSLGLPLSGKAAEPVARIKPHRLADWDLALPC